MATHRSSLLPLLACLACTTPTEPIGAATEALTCEEPGLADVVGDAQGCSTGDYCGYEEDADVTLTSYAVFKVSGSLNCTGTFIGPNIAITAAHCGVGNDGPVLNMLYRAGTYAPRTLSVTTCTRLVQSLDCLSTNPAQCPVVHDTAADAAVLHCEDVDLGGGRTIPPGLLFGYVDMESEALAVGDDAYKLWWNPVTTPPCDAVPPNPMAHHILYSPGEVWSNTSIPYGTEPRIELTNCTVPGASGSLAFDPGTHRAIVGPLSLGYGGSTCGSGNNAYSVDSLFDWWEIDLANYPNHANSALIDDLLDSPGAAAGYDGRQDKDGNDVFDIQDSIEAHDGERLRDHYWLGFESGRRNARWGHWPGVTWSPSSKWVTVANNTTTYRVVLTSPALNMQPERDYRASVHLTRTGTSTGGDISVELRDAVTLVPETTRSMTLPAGTAPNVWSFPLRTGASGRYEIVFRARGNFSVKVADFSVIADGSIMDFDTHDKRRAWTRFASGTGTAFMIPEGQEVAAASHREGTAFGDFSFAGLVRGSGPGAGPHWTLGNDNLALVPGDSYRVCFSARSQSATGGLVRARLRGLSATYASTSGTVAAAWNRYCFPGYLTPPAGDAMLEFGIDDSTKPVLVDGIDILRLAPNDGSLLAIGDTDPDAANELVQGYNSTAGAAALYITDTTSPSGPRYWGPDSDHVITAIASGDVDNDGADEIYIAVNRDDGSAAIYRAPDQASVPGALIYGYNANWFITALAIGDTDGDAVPELFTGFNGKNGEAAIYRSTTGLGIGPRIYGPSADVALTALAATDLDRDGTGEIYAAITRRTDGSEVVSREGAVGGFAVFASNVPDTVVGAMTAGRIDAGLEPELMIARNRRDGGTTITRHWRNALGVLSTETTFTHASWRVSSMGAGDMDGDELDDLYTGFDTDDGSQIYRLDGSVAGPGARVWSGLGSLRN